VPLGARRKGASKRGTHLRNRYFTVISSSTVKTRDLLVSPYLACREWLQINRLAAYHNK